MWNIISECIFLNIWQNIWMLSLSLFSELNNAKKRDALFICLLTICFSSVCFSQRRIRRLRLTLHAGDHEHREQKSANSDTVSWRFHSSSPAWLSWWEAVNGHTAVSHSPQSSALTRYYETSPSCANILDLLADQRLYLIPHLRLTQIMVTKHMAIKLH